jgi:hypothetical protein
MVHLTLEELDAEELEAEIAEGLAKLAHLRAVRAELLQCSELIQSSELRQSELMDYYDDDAVYRYVTAEQPNS